MDIEQKEKRGRPKKQVQDIDNGGEQEGNQVISKQEFEDFKKSVENTQNRILDILENQQAGKLKDNPSTEPQGSGDENSFMPSQYQKVFEKIFDTSDGFEARLNFPETDEKGREKGGIMFTIFVPGNFSNRSDAEKQFYKQDLRSKALSAHNIAKGIEDWCKLVAQNLRYDKKYNLKT